MAIGISNITNLGTIFNEENEINTRLLSVPRPAGDTSNNTTINIFGKVRTITIQGSHHGQGYGPVDVNTDINSFVQDMETWINPNIQTGETFTDSLGNTYGILSSIFRWTRVAPGNRILYTLVMTEGGALNAFSP